MRTMPSERLSHAICLRDIGGPPAQYSRTIMLMAVHPGVLVMRSNKWVGQLSSPPQDFRFISLFVDLLVDQWVSHCIKFLQNPTHVLTRIETKLSRMEMVIDGLETAMHGMTEKMNRMIQIVENWQKSLSHVAEQDALASSNVQGIPHIIKESQEPEPALPKIEVPSLKTAVTDNWI